MSRGMTKEAQKQYNRQYYLNHREERLKAITEKIRCEVCQRDISQSNFSRHLKSTRHEENQKKKLTTQLPDGITLEGLLTIAKMLSQKSK